MDSQIGENYHEVTKSQEMLMSISAQELVKFQMGI